MPRKACIDDGCNPELVADATFCGIFGIPLIEKPKQFFIPKEIVPFSRRNSVANPKEAAVAFYENDVCFSEILINPEAYVNDLKRFGAMISPDCSLYWDAPLGVQITNTYRNRAVGSYYQHRGINVIPNVRWGTEETYMIDPLPEKVAFLGVERNSIVSVGTYGCICNKEEKARFRSGLEEMLEELSPEITLVYGAMPESVFGSFLGKSHFVQFDNWMKRKKGGKR